MSGVLVVGAAGQLGRVLCGSDRFGDTVVTGVDRSAMNVTDAEAVRRVVATRCPAVIVNAAAWTDVDRAEGEVGRAFAANALGPAHLAEAARATGAALIHLSTESVFDGQKLTPYVEDDAVGPLGVYGASKLAGELAVRLGQPRSVVIRTSWLIGQGPRNFLSAILDRADEGAPLRVVAGQRGTPTGVEDLADVVARVARRMVDDAAAPTGVYHYAGAGEATRHALAVEILQAQARLTGRAAPAVQALVDADHPAAAVRPLNACLCSAAIARDFGVRTRDWREMVADAVAWRLDGAGR